MPKPDVIAPPAEVRSPWAFNRSDLKQVAGRIWLFWGFHNLSLLAGGVAFFCFLAITPLTAATVLVYGLVADISTVREQMALLSRVIPAEAASVLEGQLTQVVTASAAATGVGLVFALTLSIYGGMYAANGLIAALNVINSELETRSFVRLTKRAAWPYLGGDDNRPHGVHQWRRVRVDNRPRNAALFLMGPPMPSSA